MFSHDFYQYSHIVGIGSYTGQSAPRVTPPVCTPGDPPVCTPGDPPKKGTNLQLQIFILFWTLWKPKEPRCERGSFGFWTLQNIKNWQSLRDFVDVFKMSPLFFGSAL